ncbi:MAG: pentapeptide repeat-containing protein [Acidobacteriales bacterium]|nr:pentapeptide repeat-containing protein [Terriglobales bacterium]
MKSRVPLDMVFAQLNQRRSGAFRSAASMRSRNNSRPERGYVLLALLLFVSLLAIAAIAVAPSVSLQIRRDREEELIHRGVQYSRAIKNFVKKTGAYPVRLEQLENTNNIRFLRKRYKDPITGQDFKLLHQQDVQSSFGPGINGATPLNGLGGPNGPGGAGLNSQSSFSQNQGMNASSSSQGVSPAGSQDPNQAVTQSAGLGSQKTDDDSSDKLTSKVFGSGGPIVGVVSTSKLASIREFNKKNHYNQWQFIYDPQSNASGLLMTPNQPPLQGVGPVSTTGGPSAQGGAGGSGFGNLGSGNPGLGNQGVGNQGFGNQGFGNPNGPLGGQPPSPPDQQAPQQ